MKIAVLAPAAWRCPPRDYGPWELVAYNLAEGLVKRGHEVTLFATADSKTSAKLEAIVPHPYREHPEQMPERVWETLHIGHFFEKVKDGGFDILHSHYDFIPLTYSRMVKTPLVTTIHGFSSDLIKPVYYQYKDNCYFVSISNADRDANLEYVDTVYNGINLSDFSFNPTGGDYLVFVGRISHDKGTHLAIEVAKRTKRKLIIAGIVPPEEEQYFKRLVEPQIDGKQIEYIGPVTPEPRNRVYGNALAYLHLVTFDEPFGFTLVESMATGTPVIAMNRGSIPEIIENGKTGFIVDNIDEAAFAVDRLGTIDRAACRSRAEEFSVDRMVEGYEKVYEKILSQGVKGVTGVKSIKAI